MKVKSLPKNTLDKHGQSISRGGAGESDRVSRRKIVQGAAWTVPVLALAVQAPSASASVNCSQVRGGSTGIRLQQTSNPRRYTVSATNTQTGGVGGGGVTPGDVKSFSIIYWWTVPGLTFTNTGSSSWTNLQPTGETRVIGGQLYYAFKTTFTGTFVSSGGRIYPSQGHEFQVNNYQQYNGVQICWAGENDFVAGQCAQRSGVFATSCTTMTTN